MKANADSQKPDNPTPDSQKPESQISDNNGIESEGQTLKKFGGKSSEGIERAARMKAAIIALLNNSEQPLAKADIQEKLSGIISELGYKTSNFEGQLYQLVNNGLIKKLGKNPNGPGLIYASAKHEFPLSPGKTVHDAPRVKRTYTKRSVKEDSSLPLENTQPTKQRQSEKVAPLTVDIIKSTGRIRLSINGMAIEIGVIDDQ
jgi:hypothetical protein